MANQNDKAAGNIPGPFYVDNTCVDCDMCRTIAPELLKRNEETGNSIVFKQPATQNEIALAKEALECCPTESIGFEG
jgi:ferredoxin